MTWLCAVQYRKDIHAYLRRYKTTEVPPLEAIILETSLKESRFFLLFALLCFITTIVNIAIIIIIIFRFV